MKIFVTLIEIIISANYQSLTHQVAAFEPENRIVDVYNKINGHIVYKTTYNILPSKDWVNFDVTTLHCLTMYI